MYICSQKTGWFMRYNPTHPQPIDVCVYLCVGFSVQVILTCTVDVIDLLGIYVCLTKFTARYDAAASKIKVLSTVVGEWVGTRGGRET